MNKWTKKLLSLVLAAALLLSCTPLTSAEGTVGTEPETTVSEETTAPTEETTEPSEESVDPTEETTEPEEETEPEETSEPTEVQEPTEAPSEDPTGETEETTEETEPEETEEPEEDETVELPFGFQGLPDGYVLSESALAEKQVLIDEAVLDELTVMAAGTDYETDTMTIHAETREIAEIYAAAYSAELVDYFDGTGLIRLTTATAAEAVEAAQDMELPLPAANPNYIISLDPNEDYSAVLSQDGISTQSTTPQRMDWNTWINEVFDQPDPALLQPADKNGSHSWWNDNYQYMHDTMDTYGAWGVTMGYGVKVAVVDTGVMANHPDLSGKVTEYDIGYGTGDGAGHGTHVAGIIAASVNNGLGGAGIAPGAEIISVRVFNGNGKTSDYYVAKGIDKAVAAGAQVINLSLGGPGFSQDLKRAVTQAINKGVCVVAAMGNDGMNQVSYPAAFDGVIGVVASDTNNTRAQYSNFGPWADIAAPGTAIYSSTYDGSFGLKDGTSMAAPAVSGAVALYKSVHYDATPKQIESRMKATATKGGKDLGVGIVNVAKMLSEQPAAPIAWVLDENNELIASSQDGTLKNMVPCESKLAIVSTIEDVNHFFVFTLDGKTPAVKNGSVAVGEVYVEPIDLSRYAGQTITLKTMQVNGLGMAGKVLTQKIKVSNTWKITGMEITGPDRVVAGKKGEFRATVYPVDKASQSVTWSIVSSMAAGVTINAKTGAVSTKTTSDGRVQIRATSTTDPSKYAEFTFRVERCFPVKTLTLDTYKHTMFVGDSAALRVTTAVNTNNDRVAVSNLEFIWSSSNQKVATVDADGRVVAVAKGSATIICKVLDGSGKTVKCTVTVKQQVEELVISGQGGMAPGTSATYKANAYPATASEKGVYWSVVDAPKGTTISASGKVTLPKMVEEGVDHFLVQALAKDGSGISRRFSVMIAPKCTRVGVYASNAPGNAPGLVYNRQGILTGVGMFNVDLQNTDGVENQVSLNAYAEGNSVPILWTSSNPAIASIDNGLVTAHKAGSATITAAAQDGSGKKATIAVKVTVPVSSMSLTSSAEKGTVGLDTMAIGKTYSHTVSFGSLYGAPTNRKVQWSWIVTTIRNGQLVNVSSAVNGMVSCNSGRLSVKSGVTSVLSRYGNLQATIYAEALDGSGVVALRTYNLVRGATFVKFINGLRRDNSGNYYLTFVSDQVVSSSSSGYKFGDFVVTSSNSRVVNPIEVSTSSSYNSYYGGYVHWLVISSDMHTGKATITVKTTDGTNKTAKFTVTVN